MIRWILGLLMTRVFSPMNAIKSHVIVNVEKGIEDRVFEQVTLDVYLDSCRNLNVAIDQRISNIVHLRRALSWC